MILLIVRYLIIVHPVDTGAQWPGPNVRRQPQGRLTGQVPSNLSDGAGVTLAWCGSFVLRWDSDADSAAFSPQSLPWCWCSL